VFELSLFVLFYPRVCKEGWEIVCFRFGRLVNSVMLVCGRNRDVHFNRLTANQLINTINYNGISHLFICIVFSNLSKYFKRFSAWLK